MQIPGAVYGSEMRAYPRLTSRQQAVIIKLAAPVLGRSEGYTMSHVCKFQSFSDLAILGAPPDPIATDGGVRHNCMEAHWDRIQVAQHVSQGL